MQIGILECTGIMGQDLVHPYIQSTTVLCDRLYLGSVIGSCSATHRRTSTMVRPRVGTALRSRPSISNSSLVPVSVPIPLVINPSPKGCFKTLFLHFLISYFPFLVSSFLVSLLPSLDGGSHEATELFERI